MIPPSNYGPTPPLGEVILAPTIIATAAQIAAPTASMIAAVSVTYQLNVAPYTRYQSNGTTLIAVSAAGNIAVYADQFASLQAAHDSLPSTGGMILLGANATYTQTSTLTISKPNVTIWAPSWSTVIKRGAAMSTGQIVYVTGAGSGIANVTIDGALVVTNASDLQLAGANSIASNIQAINGAGTIQVALTGANSRITGSTITGAGGATNTAYGIWAIGTVPVTIDFNTITATGIDAIGASGAGTRVIGNNISGCHTYTGGGGGQLVIYANATGGAQIVVTGNTIGQGGATTSGGMEISGSNVMMNGNSVINPFGGGISLAAGKGIVVTGNTILNVGQDASGNQDGIYIHANVTDFVISGNRIADDQITPTMRWPIIVNAGTSDRFVISGNLCEPSNRPNGPVNDDSTGTHKVIRDNGGVDDLAPNIASAATITLPVSPVFNLTGSVGVTALAVTNQAIGKTVTMIPNGAVVFTGGAGTIGNTVTTVANVPMTATFTGTNWYFK